MAWLGLAAGVILVVLGLGIRFFKGPNKQKKSKNKIDNYRFNHDDYRREILKRNQGYNKINKNNKPDNFENQEIKRYEKNQNDLKKINSELEELISELSTREKILKNKIRDLNDEVLSGSKVSFNQSLKQANKKDDNLPLKYLDAIEMYNEGTSLAEIAESLEIGIREAELIIKMYGRGKRNNG
ncbi:hypothetical protein I0Q91_01330 [Halanaerobiaceae bacterium Z-7014]|uniref:DUF2802 domain-containing protein n=1 Tax=Halonatronomonas betaini TaxID=2778430 RepID=A0A931ASL1_9FIRM|nr:hypothetical protein [Halonatronomonas betaini]MBF8435710.1 hypothetical protein [Halonatronomonas betaini]